VAVYTFRHPPTVRVGGDDYHPAGDLSPEEMSDRDLVIAIIGPQGCRHLQGLPPEGLLGLTSLAVPALSTTLHVTHRAARRLAHALELHRRILRARIPDRPIIKTPEAVHEVMLPWADLDHERFWCLALDCRCRLIGDPIMVSAGDIDGTEAGPRTFFRGALRYGAISVVAVHNHPTGEVAPSAADRHITGRLVAAGRTLDITLTDHVIIGPGGASYSFRRDRPEMFAG
jgi:DNA repair protein RadC